MRDAILGAVAKARSRLNLAIVAHRAFAWAIPSAAAAGLASIVLRIAGAEGSAVPAWAFVVLAGAAAGAIRGRGARMGSRDAARWIDERLGNGELLSAALACIERGRSGRFDDAVLEKAASGLEPARALRAPLRPTARKAAFAVAAAAASLIAVLLARPLDPYGRGEAGPSAGAQASLGRGAASDSREADGAAVAAALAASIFPGDKRMATLAERALREGRMDDFRDILDGADIESTSKIEQAVRELEKRKLTRDVQPEGGAAGISAAAMPELGASPGAGGAAEGEAGGRDGPEGAGGMGPQAGMNGPDGGGFDGGEGPDGQPRYPPQGSAGSGESRGGGNDPSTEGTGDSYDWGEIEARAEGGELALKEAEASFFELVLPGEGASAPASEMLPSSARAAESAMSREGVPLEYLDFVRSYFTALSKGETE